MLTQRIAAAAVLTILELATTNTANAQSFRHVDYLASQLEGKAKDLQYEFGRSFRHAVQYRHLMSDARQIAGLASHIHELVHHPHRGVIHHLEDDLRSLDRQFHHLEALVAQILRAARYGHGHVHGCTWRVRSKMASMSRTLHHLKDDVERLARQMKHSHSHSVIVPRRGVTINAGPIRFRIGRP